MGQKGNVLFLISKVSYHAGCKKRDPHHLDGPDRKTKWAEAREIDDQHNDDAQGAMARVQVPLQPVVWGVMAELGECVGILGLGAIEFRALPQNFPQTQHLRAVWVLFRLAACMMLAVDGHPFLRHHARREP